jgi:hypothetical protein
MKRKLIHALCALMLTTLTGCIAFVFVGCRHVSVENRGEGKGWCIGITSNMMKSELENLKATVSPDGSITYEMGGLASSPSEELAKSLMTMTYIARLAAAMYSPAAASVPLSEEAADPAAVASLVKAQAEAKAILAKAKAEAAALKSQANGATNAVAAAQSQK